jgi:glycerol-3-phosphate cytidylyltransferase
MSKVLVPGVFDVFHIGHLNYLLAASRQGDELIVAVEEDRAVEQQKGVRPVTSLAERIALIEQLRFVSAVVSYADVFQGPLLEALGIDVFACGDEYGHTPEYPDQIKTLEYCAAHGIAVVPIPRTALVSSTAIRSQLQRFWSSRAAKESDLPAGVTTLGSFGGDQQQMREETMRECGLIEQCAARHGATSLIDLGCGDGRHLAEIAGKFERVEGVDYSAELINIARRKLNAFPNTCLHVGDSTEFRSKNQFDIILLSGLTPCLDDAQFEQIQERLMELSHPGSQLLIRTSIATKKRFDLINFFSPELGRLYTTYYRTKTEIIEATEKRGWRLNAEFQLYQHRPDTAVAWFEFSRQVPA